MMLAITFFASCYLMFLGLLIVGWLQTKKVSGAYSGKVSVIIAVRNEAKNIKTLLDSVLDQDYEKYEVIIVDDHSEDDTRAIVESMNNKLLTCVANEGLGKKAAVLTGVNHAKGEVILCTDGDCKVSSTWIKTMVEGFDNNQVQFISGPLMYSGVKLFDRLQQIELASLIGTGASTIFFNRPTMCNGGNIAYRKQGFIDVGGYQNNLSVTSGDDEFLMHNIGKKFGAQSIQYQKSKAAIVYTESNNNWREFYHQRKRWASKWQFYKLNYVKLLAVMVFLWHLLFPGLLVLSVLGYVSWCYTGVLFGLKLIGEYLFLSSVLTFMKVKNHVFLFILVEIFYDFYVLFFALISRRSKFKWKGRGIHH